MRRWYAGLEGSADRIGGYVSKEKMWAYAIRQAGRNAAHGAPIPPTVFAFEKLEHQLLMISPQEYG